MGWKMWEFLKIRDTSLGVSILGSIFIYHAVVMAATGLMSRRRSADLLLPAGHRLAFLSRRVTTSKGSAAWLHHLTHPSSSAATTLKHSCRLRLHVQSSRFRQLLGRPKTGCSQNYGPLWVTAYITAASI